MVNMIKWLRNLFKKINGDCNSSYTLSLRIQSEIYKILTECGRTGTFQVAQKCHELIDDLSNSICCCYEEDDFVIIDIFGYEPEVFVFEGKPSDETLKEMLEAIKKAIYYKACILTVISAVKKVGYECDYDERHDKFSVLINGDKHCFAGFIDDNVIKIVTKNHDNWHGVFPDWSCYYYETNDIANIEKTTQESIKDFVGYQLNYI